MRSWFKIISIPVVVVFSTAVAVGCGSEETKVAKLDPSKVLNDTFSSSAKLKSGVVDAHIKFEGAEAEKATAGGFDISGKFQVAGEKSFPELDLKISGQGDSSPIPMNIGIISAGKKMFMKMNGQAYELPAEMMTELNKSYEQAQSKDGASALSAFGFDFKEWFVSPKIAGEEKINGESVVKLTTSVDKTKMFAQLKKMMGKMQVLSPGANQAQVAKESSKAIDQLSTAFKSADVQLYSGKKDHLIRRLVIDLKLNAVAGLLPKGGTVKIDVNLSNVNKKQSIKAPANAKPMEEMVGDISKQLGTSGEALEKALQGADSGAGATGKAAGAQGEGGAPSSEEMAKLQKAMTNYVECMKKAGKDASAVNKCTEALAKARS